MSKLKSRPPSFDSAIKDQITGRSFSSVWLDEASKIAVSAYDNVEWKVTNDGALEYEYGQNYDDPEPKPEKMSQAEKELPATWNKEPEWFTVENHPFKSDLEFQRYFVKVLMWEIEQSGWLFEVQGPCKISYDGSFHKFMGMEKFRLDYIDIEEVLDENSIEGIGINPSRFFFTALEAQTVNKLYGIKKSTVRQLFGDAVLDWLEESITALYKDENLLAISADIAKKELMKKYEGTTIEFGGW